MRSARAVDQWSGFVREAAPSSPAGYAKVNPEHRGTALRLQHGIGAPESTGEVSRESTAALAASLKRIFDDTSRRAERALCQSKDAEEEAASIGDAWFFSNNANRARDALFTLQASSQLADRLVDVPWSMRNAFGAKAQVLHELVTIAGIVGHGGSAAEPHVLETIQSCANWSRVRDFAHVAEAVFVAGWGADRRQPQFVDNVLGRESRLYRDHPSLVYKTLPDFLRTVADLLRNKDLEPAMKRARRHNLIDGLKSTADSIQKGGVLGFESDYSKVFAGPTKVIQDLPNTDLENLVHGLESLGRSICDDTTRVLFHLDGPNPAEEIERRARAAGHLIMRRGKTI